MIPGRAPHDAEGAPDADLLNEIGIELRDIVGDLRRPILLYAEYGPTHISVAIFRDNADAVVRVEGPDLTPLVILLADLWDGVAPDKRWIEMEYVLRGRKVGVAFTYPGELDPHEAAPARRAHVVARHFGPKPIVDPQPD